MITTIFRFSKLFIAKTRLWWSGKEQLDDDDQKNGEKATAYRLTQCKEQATHSKRFDEEQHKVVQENHDAREGEKPEPAHLTDADGTREFVPVSGRHIAQYVRSAICKEYRGDGVHAERLGEKIYQEAKNKCEQKSSVGREVYR